MRAKYTEEFENFWGLYPPRLHDGGPPVKVGKRNAFMVWQRMTKDDRKLAFLGVKFLPRSGSKWVKDCFRWLRDAGWEDYKVAIVSTKPPNPPQDAKSPKNPFHCTNCNRNVSYSECQPEQHGAYRHSCGHLVILCPR